MEILQQEYDKNHYKIECTESWFSTQLDHSKLNDGHYFIHVKKDVPTHSSPIHLVCMRLVFANGCTKDDDVFMLPVANCKFGKDSELCVGIEDERQIEMFKQAKYWQLEVLDQDDLYVFTAPQKPKLIPVND